MPIVGSQIVRALHSPSCAYFNSNLGFGRPLSRAANPGTTPADTPANCWWGVLMGNSPGHTYRRLYRPPE